MQDSIGKKRQSVSDDQLLESQPTANHLFILLICSLDLFPLRDLCTFFLLFPSLCSWQRGGDFEGQAWKEARGDYFEVPLSPHAKLSRQFYGFWHDFCTYSSGHPLLFLGGAIWNDILCPFSLSVCRQGYQRNKLWKCLLFTGFNMWEGEKGNLNSISTQTCLQIFCIGLNLIVNFKKNLNKQNFTPSSQ